MEARISGHTQLYCLLGSPVGHSQSPAMYNESFARTGVDGAYLAFEITLDQLEQAIQAVRTFHVKGFNVTMPNKSAVLRYLDEITPAAQLVGACNTVTATEDGKLLGHNTDGVGFCDNLRHHGIDPKGKKLVVLGAGGAASAICAQAALDSVAQLHLFNRRDEFFPKGQRLVARVREAVPECEITFTDLAEQKALAAAIANSDVLVNATNVGMTPLDGESLVGREMLRPDLVVADAVYNPLETKLLREAKAAGCSKVLDGIGMMLWQGVAAFRLFTGKEMPQEVRERFSKG